LIVNGNLPENQGGIYRVVSKAFLIFSWKMEREKGFEPSTIVDADEKEERKGPSCFY